MISVLVVERDPAVAQLFREVLGEEGFAVRVRSDMQAALADLSRDPAQVLVADEPSMGGNVSGWLPQARRVHQGPVVVLGLDRRRPAAKWPGLHVLPKSSDLRPLIRSLHRQALIFAWSGQHSFSC